MGGFEIWMVFERSSHTGYYSVLSGWYRLVLALAHDASRWIERWVPDDRLLLAHSHSLTRTELASTRPTRPVWRGWPSSGTPCVARVCRSRPARQM